MNRVKCLLLTQRPRVVICTVLDFSSAASDGHFLSCNNYFPSALDSSNFLNVRLRLSGHSRDAWTVLRVRPHTNEILRLFW